MKIACLAGIVACVLLATGCASPGPNSGQARAAADRALENKIREELGHYGELQADAPNIHIVARDGLVTLAGPVRTDKSRAMLVTMVRHTSGVTGVSDQLLVIYPATGMPTPPPFNPAPVYRTIPPGVTPPAVVVVPGPATVPNVLPGTPADQSLAQRIIIQLQGDNIPSEWLQGVTISVAGGSVYLQGFVGSEQARGAIVASLQHCRGVGAVYDQTQLR